MGFVFANLYTSFVRVSANFIHPAMPSANPRRVDATACIEWWTIALISVERRNTGCVDVPMEQPLFQALLKASGNARAIDILPFLRI